MQPTANHVALDATLNHWCEALRGAIEAHPGKEVIEWALG